MPELPEVETIRLQLQPLLSGNTISRVDVLDPKAVEPASPDSFKRRLRGTAVKKLDRRGKYLLIGLDTEDTLVIHLRMTGTLTYLQLPLPVEKKPHLRLLFRFDGGNGLAFHDTRRFGRVFVLSPEENRRYWTRFGPEPLERGFTHSYMRSLLEGRSRPIKSLLLDQAMIAGIGNIYADEALYEAGILPTRPAGSLDDDEIRRLIKSIKATLRKAIRLQGSSIDTYRDAQGRKGSFQETFQVHRKQGKPCPACGTHVEKIRVGGRGTYFCPICQK